MHNSEARTGTAEVASVAAAAAGSSGHSARSSYICGGLSAISNVIIIFPLHKIIFRQQLLNIDFRLATHQVLRQEFWSMYRGVLPPLLQRTCNLSLMFGCYASFTRQLEQLVPQSSPYARKAASAFMAGSCEAMLMPFERVQTLLQDSRNQCVYRNTFHAFAELRQRHGLREWYRGLTAILLRNGCSSVLYFLLKEQMEQRLPGSGVAKDFTNGAVLGAFLSTLTYPLNVAKTHMQKCAGGEFVSVPVCLLAQHHSRGSVRLLFRGALPNCARAMLSWGIITASFEFFSRCLGDSTSTP